MKSQCVPVLVALAAIGTILAAGACGPQTVPQHPCPTSGCEVPGPDDSRRDLSYQVTACMDTGAKGPCQAIALATNGVCHWWFVDLGHNLYDGTARDLGIWELGADEECV